MPVLKPRGLYKNRGVHGRPRFAKHSRDDGKKASLQPYIRTFTAAMPLSLMECAGWVPIDSMHSKCVAPDGFGQPRSYLFRHHCMIARAIVGRSFCWVCVFGSDYAAATLGT